MGDWHKFKLGSFVIHNNIIYKVYSIESDNQNPNKYTLVRLWPKENYPIRNINETELKQWEGEIGK